MAQAVVNIAGRIYRMSCDEGEAAHIEDLARLLEARIDALRGSFAEIGHERIVVMAALTVVDEFCATQKQLTDKQAELEAARAEAERARARQQEIAEWAAKALDKATARIVAATRALNEV